MKKSKLKEINVIEIKDKLISQGIIKKQKGKILMDFFFIKAEKINPDVVGSMLQTWLESWLKKNRYYFDIQKDTQKRPDIFLKKGNVCEGLLEVKAFYKSPAFDIQSWNAFLNLMLESPNHIYADYLIFNYDIINNSHFIMKNIFVKKIWELSKPMGKNAKISWPVNVQYKNNEIVNLRPIQTQDLLTNKSYFNSALDFLNAIQKTIDIYEKADQSYKNNKWLNLVKKKYKNINNKDLI